MAPAEAKNQGNQEVFAGSSLVMLYDSELLVQLVIDFRFVAGCQETNDS